MPLGPYGSRRLGGTWVTGVAEAGFKPRWRPPEPPWRGRTDGSLRQTVNLKYRLLQSTTVIKFKHVGLDVHAETVAIAVVDSCRDARHYGIIPSYPHAVDKLVRKRVEDGTEVRAMYEACGFGHTLYEELTAAGARSRVTKTTRR